MKVRGVKCKASISLKVSKGKLIKDTKTMNFMQIMPDTWAPGFLHMAYSSFYLMAALHI